MGNNGEQIRSPAVTSPGSILECLGLAITGFLFVSTYYGPGILQGTWKCRALHKRAEHQPAESLNLQTDCKNDRQLMDCSGVWENLFKSLVSPWRWLLLNTMAGRVSSRQLEQNLGLEDWKWDMSEESKAYLQSWSRENEGTKTCNSERSGWDKYYRGLNDTIRT